MSPDMRPTAYRRSGARYREQPAATVTGLTRVHVVFNMHRCHPKMFPSSKPSKGLLNSGASQSGVWLSTLSQVRVDPCTLAMNPQIRLMTYSTRPEEIGAATYQSGRYNRFQGNGRIGQGADVPGVTGGDESPAPQEAAGRGGRGGAVHGEQGDQASGRQPARRPGRGGGITAPQEVLGVAVVARILHHATELLGPEIRHRVVDLVAAEQVGRDH